MQFAVFAAGALHAKGKSVLELPRPGAFIVVPTIRHICRHYCFSGCRLSNSSIMETEP